MAQRKPEFHQVDFFVEGTPVPQPRPRARAVCVRGKWVARVYNPNTADAWKHTVAIMAMRCPDRPRQPISSPVMLRLLFLMARESRCDVDNLTKSVMDSLTDIGWWKDDSQVFDLEVVRRRALPVEPTGVRVTVAWTEPRS